MFRQHAFKLFGMVCILFVLSFITIDTKDVLASSISVNVNKESGDGYTDLSTAIEAATSGDVIYLHPGVYQLPKTRLNKSLDFKRFGQGTVKIIPRDHLVEGEPWIQVVDGHKVTFDHLIFDGSNKQVSTMIDASGYIEMTNSIIKNFSYDYEGEGIRLHNGGLLYENEFSQIGSKSVVLTGSEETKIIDNNFVGNGYEEHLEIAVLIESQGDTVISGNHMTNYKGTVSNQDSLTGSAAVYISKIQGTNAGGITIKKNVFEENHYALVVGNLSNNNMKIEVNQNAMLNHDTTIINLDREFYIDARMNYYGVNPAGPDGITGLVHYFPWALSKDYKTVVNNMKDRIIIDDDYKALSKYSHVAYDQNRDGEVEHYYYGVNAFSNVNEAIEHAIEGSTLILESGQYDVVQSLVIDKGISLSGVEKESVVLNASNLLNHAIFISNQNVEEVVLSGFTLIGTGTEYSGIYAAGTRELRLENFIVKEFSKNGIELNTVSDGVIKDVEALNQGKNGVEFRNSRYLSVENLVTSGNGNKGLGVVTEDAMFYGIETTDYITIKNMDGLEDGLYLESSDQLNQFISYRTSEQLPHANVTLLSDDVEFSYHALHKENVYQTLFFKGLVEAKQFIEVNDYTSIYLKNVVDDYYIVTDAMDIMDTIEHASDEDTLYLESGVHYIPKVTIEKDIDFIGTPPSEGESVLKLYEHTSLDEAYLTVAKDGISFESITFDGTTTNIFTALKADASVSVIDSTFRGINYNDASGTAIHIKDDAVLRGNAFYTPGHSGILVDSHKESTITIEGNVYTGNGEGNTVDYGIMVNQFGRLMIEGNLFRTYLGKDESTYSAGINIMDRMNASQESIIIEGNTFTDNLVGILVQGDVAPNLKVNAHYNTFSDYVKNIVNSSQLTVNATHNYFGNGLDQPIPDTMVGDINYFPWLIDDLNTLVNDGVENLVVDESLTDHSHFDVVIADVNKDGMNEYYYYGVNAFSTVEEAVQQSQNGSSIYIRKGTYTINEDLEITKELKLIGTEQEAVTVMVNKESSIYLNASNIQIMNLTFTSGEDMFTPLTVDLYEGMILPIISNNQFEAGSSLAFVLNDQTLDVIYIESIVSTNELQSYSYLLKDSNSLKEEPVYRIYSSYNEGFNHAILGERIVFKKATSSNQVDLLIGELVDSFLADVAFFKEGPVISIKGKLDTESINYYYKINDDEWKLYQNSFTLTSPGLNTLVIEARDASKHVMTVYDGQIIIMEDGPNLSNLQNLSVEVGGLIDYIQSQNIHSDADYLQAINVNDDEVNLDQVGSYNVTYTVHDLLGNVTSKTITVDVVDTNAPTFLTDHLVLEVSDYEGVGNRQVNELTGILKLDHIIEDDYDEQVTIRVEALQDQYINFSQIGIYRVKVIAADSSNNVTEKIINIIIADQTAPELTYTQTNFELLTENIDWLSYCKITDLYFNRERLDVTLVDTNVNIKKVGTYQITVQVIDPAGNTLLKTIDINIVDTTPPIIKGGKKERTIKEGDDFNPLAGLTFIDDGTADFTDHVQVLGDYDVNKRGEYLITIVVEDESGNQTIDTYTLVVEQSIWKVILIGLSGLGTLIFVIVVLQALRMRNEGKGEVDTQINLTDQTNREQIYNDDHEVLNEDYEILRLSSEAEPDESEDDDEHDSDDLNNY